ncbi:hypothetical protein SAMN02927921_03915 [Sinomicrobium oceani]|uniref:Uncharacterized protein n=1 Tax=Sinomicrobium oceani TaxID=1150368 RepID=A0A1K1RS93_9FLAO|nr:hypothetical protein [Sinomicrobium oceani]SFW74685.1 hypothetical protein SAMN02927921_03915 [Sinomicrobium oceani]
MRSKFYLLLLNRLFFTLLPGLILLLISLKTRLKEPVWNEWKKDDFLLPIVLGLLLWGIIEIRGITRYLRKRKQKFQDYTLQPVPEPTPLSERFSLLNNKVLSSPADLSIINRDLHISLYINRKEQLIEVQKSTGAEKISFSDIRYMVLEYVHEDVYTLRGFFTRGRYDKTFWQNTFSVVLKSGQVVPLFHDRLKQHKKDELQHELTSGSYIHVGERGIKLLSFITGKAYMIIDYSNP